MDVSGPLKKEIASLEKMIPQLTVTNVTICPG